MDAHYTGYLPQGAIVVHNLNEDYRYILPPSRTLCFPWKMRTDYKNSEYTQLIIDVADTTPFEITFTPGARCWASKEPASQSITATPYASQSSVYLIPSGMKWNFWLLDKVPPECREPASIDRGIEPGIRYWFNVQNMQNRQSNFFCRFTYTGLGIKYVE